jgi:hypothetical protein
MPRKQIPLLSNQGIYQNNDSNDGLADYPFFFNGYFEDTGNSTSDVRKYSYIKRPGLSNVIASGFTANHKIYAMSSSPNKTQAIVYTSTGAAARTWFLSGTVLTDKGVPPAAAGSWTNTTGVAMTLLDINAYNGYQWAVTDMTKGAVVDINGAWTEITDADFTALNKVSNFCALDGYLFIGDGRNRVYNSDLNTPGSWDPLSFISANNFPGQIRWLTKVRNYLAVFKENSIEFFEDVGNPTPGSPLEARKQLDRSIGLLNRNTIQEVSDGIIFAGRTPSGGNKLYKLEKDSLQIKEISTRYVQQCLNTVVDTNTYSLEPNLSTSLSGQSQVFTIAGKDFYAISLYEPLALPVTNTLQVYDNNLNIWTTWASSVGNSGVTDTYGWAGSNCIMYYRAISNSLIAMFADNTGTSGRLLAIDMQAPNWYDSSSSGAQNSYTLAWTSDVFDFGNRKRKFMDSFEVLYDIDSSISPPGTSATMTLKYRDFDYVSSPGYIGARTLTVNTSGYTKALASQLGCFRRRAFTLQYTVNTAMRIWGIEVNINEGETEQDS